MTPAQSSYTIIVPCAFAAGNIILRVSTHFIALSPNSEEPRPQGCTVAIAPRATGGNPVRNAPMICGTSNMSCGIIIIQRDVVDVVARLKPRGKIVCSSGVGLVSLYLFICGD